MYWALRWVLSTKKSFKFAQLQGNAQCARKILDQLTKLIAHHKQLQVVSRQWPTLPPYKFYTPILETILQYSTQYGVPITQHLKALRKCLIQDWEFEQKLTGHLFATGGQIVTITSLTWGFGGFCQWMLQLWPEPSKLLLVGALQALGGVVFFILYQKRKIHLFRPYERCYQAVIAANILQHLGISLHSAKVQCSLDGLPKSGPLGEIRERLQELFHQCHHQGHSIRDFLWELREELDFYLAEDFKKFLQFTAKIKFLILALFYLPAYLIFVFSLFGEILPP